MKAFPLLLAGALCVAVGCQPQPADFGSGISLYRQNEIAEARAVETARRALALGPCRVVMA